ncbi:apolipoprotein N-acyltransferase [Kitasatospora sp. SUK 42]|uniref:apolipoprotein N-acyltransferase n=1 Tax=Kitasatospora sp. SUK 42 TaxID=1588882 RepID=UPI0018C901FF|nr:apolipoprotein N-acyltransferase [Kitasatospora sp. SUK 42]MBV2155235.1 apolipoprotein N-acyltransferase [Kitasatospora sp. SUK 42]
MPVTQERSGTTPEPQEPASTPGRTARALAKVRAGLPRTGLAVLSGLLLALAFPPYDLWPLSLLGAAALSLLTRGRTARQGAWTGFAFGLPFFLLLLSWLRVIGWDATIGLSVIEALFIALLGSGLAVTSRLPGWPVWAAALWVTQEWARDRLPLGGFPWGRLAFANTATPYTPLAALGGAPLVTFAVALSGALLAWAALRLRRPAGVTLKTGPWAAALAALGAVAALLAGYLVPVPTAAADTVKVAIVQGNVPNPGMDFLGRPMMVLNNHASATERLAADIQAGKVPQPDIVIWPENSSDLDPFSDPLARQRIDEAVKAVGVPTLVGTLVDGPDAQHVQNEGIVWDPKTGPGASYTKQHPVPFGEYVPFRAQLMKVVTRLQRVARDFYPGDHNGVMQLGPARIGDVICFEVAYDEIVRDTVDSGARVLVVQTNNATYAKTGQPEQQLAMSRLRAVEHGRAVLIAATSGISAVIAPDGTVEQRTEELTPAELSATVPLRDGTTVADRIGAAPEWTLAIGGLLACGAAVLVGRGRKRSAGTPAERESLDQMVP